MVAADVHTLVPAVRPVLLAVIDRRRLLDDLRAGGPGPRAVRLRVVDINKHALRVRPANLARGPRVRESIRFGLTNHDEPLAVGELRVHDAPGLSIDDEPHLES